MSGASLVSFENVSFAYDGARGQALSGLSLSLRGGISTAILGPNGAGKTTLLHLVTGYLKPASGRMLFEGRPLEDYSRRELGRNIALVPQAEAIAFQYTVLEFVTLGRAPHLPSLGMPGPRDKTAALSALARLGIEDLAGRDVTTLSGGERQLASIARALAQEARLILLDEPMSHLDLAHKARILSVLRQLEKSGTSLVFSTHEPEVASAIAKDIVLMRRGGLLDAGPAEAMIRQEKLEATYGIPLRLVQFEGRPHVLWAEEEGRE